MSALDSIPSQTKSHMFLQGAGRLGAHRHTTIIIISNEIIIMEGSEIFHGSFNFHILCYFQDPAGI